MNSPETRDPSPAARIAEALAGELSPSERAALDAWRAESPEHEAEFQAHARIAALAAQLPRDTDAGPPPTAAELIERAGERRDRFALARRRAFPVGMWPAAAAILLVALGMAVLRTGKEERQTAAAPANAVRLATGAAETASLELPDGSIIKLAPNSRLSFERSANRREATLEGKAFFAVAKRREPFVIRTGAGELSVVGTRFHVETRGDNLELLVTDGRVVLSAAGSRAEVAAGELGRVVAGEAEPLIQVTDPAPYLAWTGRFLAFQSTPLEDAAREIERVYGVRVELLDQALAGRVITAWFTDRPLTEVLDLVCLAVGAVCDMEGDIIRMSPRSSAVNRDHR